MRREVDLVDGKTAQTIHSAVRTDHGDAQQYRLLRGAGQGQKLCGAAGALYGRGRCFKLVGKAGEIGRTKFLRPLPMRHHPMLTTDVRHAPVEQQIAGGMLGVAALHIKSAEGIRRSIGVERDAQQHEAAGAICLLHILAQGPEHGCLELLQGVRAAGERVKVLHALLDQGRHILREMHAHDRDVPPQGGHVRAEGLHLEGQGFFHLLPRALELPEQKQNGKEREQQQRCQRAHIEQQPPAHGGLSSFQF